MRTSSIPSLPSLPGFQGRAIVPGMPGYDRARRVRNARVDRRPALIARCTGVDDIIAVLAYARGSGLPVAVRGRGAHVAGWGTCDGGVVLDLGGMKHIEVEPASRTATAEPGLTWGEFDDATQRFGLALPGARNTDVGIAGHTLGGGIGDLSRQHGLTSDNVEFFDVVTADGRYLRADGSCHGDLFWALRGGGGNFGVVTRFGFRLHPVTGVIAGALVHPADRARTVLRTARDWLTTAPDEASLITMVWTAPPLPFVPERLHFERCVVLIPTWFGPAHLADEVLGPLRHGAQRPLADTVTEMTYTNYQRLLPSAPDHTSQHVYNRGEFLPDLTNAVIDRLVSHWEAAGPNFSVVLGALGGAIGRAPAGPTAFTHRHARWFVEVCAQWFGQADSPVHTEPARTAWQDLQDASAGPYLNLLPDPEPRWASAAYGEETYARLRDLKETWDPDHLFRFNAPLPPRTAKEND